MYYNLTSEERYILTLSDTMLKEGYTVDEVIEFLQCEDMDQVECILGTLTLTESADVDHPDLELVIENARALTSIGSWLTRQAGRLKGLFGRGARKVKINLKPTTTKVRSTNRTGPAKNIRDKLGGPRVTGDVKPTLSDKVKTALKRGLKIGAAGTGAYLLYRGIEGALDGDGPAPTRDDPNQTGNDTTTTGGGGDKEDGLSKGYGSRTRKYGWWQKSHANSPYVDSVSNYNNIRAKRNNNNDKK